MMPKVLLAACFVGLVATAATASAAKYEPSWESLDKRPMPAWFDEARFGVFICWGP
jgi:alpha-L-fucosidase